MTTMTDRRKAQLSRDASVRYDQALAEVARHLGVLAHKGGQLGIAEWDLLAILPTVIVATRNHLTGGNG